MDDEGNTPLHCAVASKDITTVKTLLERQISDLGRNQFTTAPRVETGGFTQKQKEEQESLRRLLQQEGERPRVTPVQSLPSSILPPCSTYQLMETTAVDSINKGTATVDAPNEDGETPLLLAITFSCFEMAKLLIGHGAKVNQPDITKTTPAHAAVASRSADMVSYLVASGADFHAPNR